MVQDTKGREFLGASGIHSPKRVLAGTMPQASLPGHKALCPEPLMSPTTPIPTPKYQKHRSTPVADQHSPAKPRCSLGVGHLGWGRLGTSSSFLHFLTFA